MRARTPGAVLALLLGLGWPAGTAPQEQATVQLRGTVEPVCAFSLGGEVDVALSGFNVRDAGSVSQPLSLYCNAPFVGSIRSLNGGLRRAGTGDADGDIGYDVALVFDALGVVGPFDSADLVSARSFDSGAMVVFETGGALEITWRENRRARAGTYEDTLFITIEPRR